MEDDNEEITQASLDQYRKVLGLETASDEEIRLIRDHFLLVAQALCEYLLGRELD